LEGHQIKEVAFVAIHKCDDRVDKMDEGRWQMIVGKYEQRQ
jgi:hypothetical protein